MDVNAIINALKTVGLNYIGSLILIGVTFLLFIGCLVLSLLLFRVKKATVSNVGANSGVVAPTTDVAKQPVKKPAVKKSVVKSPPAKSSKAPVKPTKNICGVCGADLKEGEKHPCLDAE